MKNINQQNKAEEIKDFDIFDFSDIDSNSFLDKISTIAKEEEFLSQKTKDISFHENYLEYIKNSKILKKFQLKENRDFVFKNLLDVLKKQRINDFIRYVGIFEISKEEIQENQEIQEYFPELIKTAIGNNNLFNFEDLKPFINHFEELIKKEEIKELIDDKLKNTLQKGLLYIFENIKKMFNISDDIYSNPEYKQIAQKGLLSVINTFDPNLFRRIEKTFNFTKKELREDKDILLSAKNKIKEMLKNTEINDFLTLHQDLLEIPKNDIINDEENIKAAKEGILKSFSNSYASNNGDRLINYFNFNRKEILKNLGYTRINSNDFEKE